MKHVVTATLEIDNEITEYAAFLDIEDVRRDMIKRTAQLRDLILGMAREPGWQVDPNLVKLSVVWDITET